MNKYYTTIETLHNGQQFIGVVYESTSNQQVFKTSSHPTHTRVVQEVNEFLKNKLSTKSETRNASSPVFNNTTTPTVQIQNTIKPVTISGSNHRCCGR